ncbi:hypothetical protein J6590_082706 [Homalodisca vitripennis]|nr:hypothetical protein J6590_082706 [Homalodisca vitripennis]
MAWCHDGKFFARKFQGEAVKTITSCEDSENACPAPTLCALVSGGACVRGHSVPIPNC